MSKVVFWDFDGTLAYRPQMFSSSLKMVLDKYEQGHQATDESFSPWLQSGFPWDEPEKDYSNFRDAEIWWDNVCKIFERAYIMYGIKPEKACKYAKEVRKYISASDYYTLFDDTADTLKFFKENGYRNIILSNHIPELPAIAEDLGLMEYIEICITSAYVGFEKPNPGIFRYAMELAGNPQEAWMVGDNLMADVRGGEAAGLKAILVRKPTNEPVKYISPDLKGTIGIIKPEK